MRTDAQLLHDYARSGSEEAFAVVVQRHVDLVYSTAFRMLGGDHRLAEDVTQMVFADLARKVRQQHSVQMVGGWLYRHTCFTAWKAVRSERRRHAREKAAMECSSPSDTDEARWSRIALLLDRALMELSPPDRDALVLRFFQKQDLQTVGRALGVSEDAAQKRVARALDKLRSYFAREGVEWTAAGLAAALTSQAVQAAPASLGIAVSAAALAAGGCVGAGSGGAFLSFMTAKLKLAAVVLTASGLVTGLVVQHHSLSQERQQASLLRAKAAALEEARAELERQLAAQLALDNDREREHRELLRLRGEVGLLRQAARHAATTNSTLPAPAPAEPAEDAPLPPSVQSYVATLQSRVPGGQTLVTGGWATQPGKRTLVLLTPHLDTSAGAGGAVTLEAKFLEAPEDALARLGLESFKADGNESSLGELLTSDEARTLSKALKEIPGLDVLASPRVTTLDGRQAQIAVQEMRTLPDGQVVPLGPTLDVIPRLTPDHESVELTVLAKLNLFNQSK